MVELLTLIIYCNQHVRHHLSRHSMQYQYHHLSSIIIIIFQRITTIIIHILRKSVYEEKKNELGNSLVKSSLNYFIVFFLTA